MKQIENSKVIMAIVLFTFSLNPMLVIAEVSLWERSSTAGIEAYEQHNDLVALEYFKAALEQSHLLQDEIRLAVSQRNLAFIYDNIGDFRQAEPLYVSALKIIKSKLGEKHPVTVWITRYMAAFYVISGAYAKAEPYLTKATDITSESIINEYPDALDNIYDVTLMPRGNKFSRSRHLFSEAWQTLLHGDYEQVLKLAGEGLEISREIKSQVGIADGLNIVGYIYYKRGHYKRALEFSQEAIDAAKSIDYLFGLGRNLSSVGSSYYRLGKFQLAKHYYNESLSIRKKLANKDEIARALNDLANVDQQLGHYWAALKQREEALDLWKGTENQVGIGDVLNDIGWTYDDLGDYDKAIEYYQRSLVIQKAIPDQWGIADGIDGIALIHFKLGHYQQAVDGFHQAHALFTEMGNREEQIRTLNHLGAALHRMKNNSVSEKNYRQALALSETVLGAGHSITANILNNLAAVHMDTGKYDEADKLLQRALNIFDETYTPQRQIEALHNMGRLRIQQNRLVDALPYFQKAVSLLQELYTGLGESSQHIRATFVGQFSLLYREYIDLLFQLHEKDQNAGYDKQAFITVEMARSRMFSEMISEARAARSILTNSKDENFRKLLEMEHDALLLVRSTARRREEFINRSDSDKDPTEFEEIVQQVEEAERNLRDVKEKLTQQYPRYADLKLPELLQLNDVKNLLNSNEVILSYFVTNTHTGLWVITDNDDQLNILPLGREQILNDTKRMRRAFSAVSNAETIIDLRSAFEMYDPLDAYALYQKLVEPAEKLLAGKQLLYIAPDDVLYQLPFEALLTKHYLPSTNDKNIIGSGLEEAPFWVKTQSISYLPSITVLRSLRTLGKHKVKPKKMLIAFADPVFKTDSIVEESEMLTRGSLLRNLRNSGALTETSLPRLPETADEARHAAKVLGVDQSDLYIGVNASERNVKQLSLNEYRFILFATHGLLAGEFKPGIQPALALSFVNDPENDGLLEMGEIMSLDLNADLVVLSACNTASGTGKNDRGEGFAGLTRSFMYAGADALLVTLWSVETTTAKTLMEDMYSMLKDENNIGALSRAKRKMIASGNKIQVAHNLSASTAHPFFWAPFIVVGEGSSMSSISRH